MGADFLLYSLPWAQLDEARQKLLHAAIDQLTDDELQDVADAAGCIDEDGLSPVRKAVHTAIGEYVALERRRDATIWRNGSDPIARVYTGGLSWGEGPTDCCHTFDIIATCLPIYDRLRRWALEEVRADAASSRPTLADSALRELLTEFCSDVEAAGRDEVAQEWPDLVVTYDKASRALKDSASEGPTQNPAAAAHE